MAAEKTLPIFRVVNGELVRKVGDERDSSKIYVQYVGDDGGHLKEFDSEDDRLSFEKAEQQKLEASLQYEERLIAFLDILGWKEAIRSQQAHELGLTLHSLNSYARHAPRQTPPSSPQSLADLKMIHFSDSIVISVRSTDSSPFNQLAGQLSFFNWLRTIVAFLMSKGFAVRGGITQGLLHHSPSLVYGPALVTAYELEQRAVYPRILADPTWRAEIIGELEKKEAPHALPMRLWAIDSDGEIFYDFFPLYFPIRDALGDRRFLQIEMNPIRTLIQSRLISFPVRGKIYKKWEWMARYFNSVVAQYPTCGVEPILLSPAWKASLSRLLHRHP